jgi:hypothetical protein
MDLEAYYKELKEQEFRVRTEIQGIEQHIKKDMTEKPSGR